MKGLGVSKGYCYTKVLVYEEKPIVLTEGSKPPQEEEKDFRQALLQVLKETEKFRDKAEQELGKEAAEIFNAHCSIVQDEEMITAVINLLQSGKNAASAVEDVFNQYIDIFSSMEDEYMANRALDVKDIKMRIQRKILDLDGPAIEELSEPVILAGWDITPSITARMDLKHVVGLMMELGGNTSHTAILARTMEIPAVVGVKGLMASVQTGQMAAINGNTGEVFLNPSQAMAEVILSGQKKDREKKESLLRLVHRETLTTDGQKAELFANIGTPQDVAKVLENGGEGIGLFRSEFLYLQSNDIPSEEKQFEAYRAVLSKMDGKAVIVRTMDIGGDKEIPALHLEKEENPFLGLRAIRLCQVKEDVFRTQVRALLKASVHGNLHIMFPMISSLSELRWAKSIVASCREELQQEGISVSEQIPLGIMVEIPSTAVMADMFARECDFFSIGTNDLIQYALAVDRGNDAVAGLYSAYHPAVLRLIKNTVDGAHNAGIICGMCGEAAGDAKLVPLLVGMGLDEFSMAPSSILETREWICGLNKKECEGLLDVAMALATADEVENLLLDFMAKRGREAC